MTTITTSILNNLYMDNKPYDPLFDFHDLFSSTHTFIHNNEYQYDSIWIEEEPKEISSSSSSSEIDQKQFETSSINNPSQKSHLSILKCGVCGAPATGYHFDQVTCESCKAFFRRNALRDIPNLKCRYIGSCVINVQTRRHCAYCRLKKCFDIKMRKEWIRTEEETELRHLKKLAKEQKKLNELTNDQQIILDLPIVVRKKKRLMTKSTAQEWTIKPIYRQTFFGSNRNLCDEDRVLLNNITNAYQLAANQVDDLHFEQYTPAMDLVEFINSETKTHESLISFYKSIPEFNKLHLEDRVLLIKFNLAELIQLHCTLMYKFQDIRWIGVYMSKWINADFHNQMSRTRRYFDRFIEHPLILKLALIVFIFSTNLSTPCGTEFNDDYTNILNIREIQDFYTTVLWRYLNSVYEEKEAIRSLEIIMIQILHLQKLMVIMEEHLERGRSHNVVNELGFSLYRLTRSR